MTTADKSSVYISIFKRKGGEGLNTKIIKENNKRNYNSLFLQLEERERGPSSGYVISVFNHNGIKEAVDETRKLIMRIRSEKGFQLL